MPFSHGTPSGLNPNRYKKFSIKKRPALPRDNVREISYPEFPVIQLTGIKKYRSAKYPTNSKLDGSKKVAAFFHESVLYSLRKKAIIKSGNRTAIRSWVKTAKTQKRQARIKYNVFLLLAFKY
ncbi:MAG: hypothetical protein Q4G07_12145 [Oscillospiraceae bacterium]|nr:hypothetical protein [Oscillospiraceae bacterium]